MDRGTARERAWAWPQAGAATRAGVAGTPNLGWLTQRTRLGISSSRGRGGTGAAGSLDADRVRTWRCDLLHGRAGAIMDRRSAARRCRDFGGVADTPACICVCGRSVDRGGSGRIWCGEPQNVRSLPTPCSNVRPTALASLDSSRCAKSASAAIALCSRSSASRASGLTLSWSAFAFRFVAAWPLRSVPT